MAETKLRGLNRNGELILVTTRYWETWMANSGISYYRTPKWLFVFRDKGDKSRFTEIEVDVETKNSHEEDTKIYEHKATSVPESYYRSMDYDEKPILDWKIDSDTAMKILEKEGGDPIEHGPPFALKMRSVDGLIVPVWILPYAHNDFRHRGVRADNGEVVYKVQIKHETWMKVERGELGIPAIDKWTSRKPKRSIH
jgi:hypothetical protein